MKTETILAILMSVLIGCCFLTFRYLQENKNFWCMFDSSPRTCAMVLK